MSDYERLADCTCFAIRGAARKITMFYDRHLSPAGIKSTQFTLLAILASEKILPLVHLAKLAQLDRTSLTRNIAVLEKKGWVEQAPSKDARQKLLRLTPAGLQKLEEAAPLWTAAQDKVKGIFGPENVGRLRDDLRAVGFLNSL